MTVHSQWQSGKQQNCGLFHDYWFYPTVSHGLPLPFPTFSHSHSLRLPINLVRLWSTALVITPPRRQPSSSSCSFIHPHPQYEPAAFPATRFSGSGRGRQHAGPSFLLANRSTVHPGRKTERKKTPVNAFELWESQYAHSLSSPLSSASLRFRPCLSQNPVAVAPLPPSLWVLLRCQQKEKQHWSQSPVRWAGVCFARHLCAWKDVLCTRRSERPAGAVHPVQQSIHLPEVPALIQLCPDKGLPETDLTFGAIKLLLIQILLFPGQVSVHKSYKSIILTFRGTVIEIGSTFLSWSL